MTLTIQQEIQRLKDLYTRRSDELKALRKSIKYLEKGEAAGNLFFLSPTKE